MTTAAITETLGTRAHARTGTTGCLALWVEIDPGDETDYVFWLTRDHMPERMEVPGFISARYYRSTLRNDSHFLVIYETENLAVLSSAAYLDRLDHPSPITRQMMPKLRRVVRGAGRLTWSQGGPGRSAVVAASRVQAEIPQWSDPTARHALIASLSDAPRISSAAWMAVDPAATDIMTREKRMRTQDESFRHALLIEATDERALDAARRAFDASLAGLMRDADSDVYALAHILERSSAEGA
jgi:hypothetical protein